IDPIDSSTAQSNWGTSRHPNRSTPGRRNSLTRKDFDITLDTLLLFPPFPIRGESVIVSARIRNAGFQAITSLLLSLFDDANDDSIPQPSEFITLVVHGNPLLPLDSVLISFVPFHPTRMEHLLIATVQTSPDEDTLNNRQLLRLLVGIPRSSVVINEVMYSPVSEPEWVELYNTTAESVDVKGWKLGNRTTSSRYNVASTSIFIQPRKPAVIAKDTALLLQRYQQVPGLVIQAPALPTFLFNNTGDAVVIFDQRDQLVDSVKYSPTWGGNNGVSLERIDAMIESNDSANWSSSVDSLRGTPGRENSIVALDHDLRAMKNVTLVAPPHVSAMLSVTVQNIGRMASTPFDVTFFDDLNRDSVATPDELITSAHVAQSLARSETVRVAAQWPDPPSGIHTVVARVEYAPDLRPANNTTMFTVKIGYEPRAVVINEIMYAPFTNEAEYVELVNVGMVDVDLSGWKLLDRPGTSGSSNEFPLASQRRILPPGGYFIIASDSSIFSRFRGLDTTRHGFVTVANQSSLSFNNDGDAVIVRDATLGTIDSVAYSPTWHNPAVTDATGRALEKINPSLSSNDARGWSTCVFVVGGTPGVVNSVYAASLPTQAKLSCSPNPFSPDGDGNEDFSVIHYELPIDIAVVNLKIFDVKGRLIRYLVNSEPSGARRDVIWDGYDDERQRSRVGIYIVLVEGLNEGGGSVYSAKGVVVLAAKL
ncbi:MAG: hypothetical protein HW412_2511, partial [Bacteroidetes bacterium]|nr:hypothetical protein [Bacteroidota bacterium]